MDTLPLEILDLIAVRDPADYNAFVRAVPRYARADSIGRRFDAMAAMGYDYRVRKVATLTSYTIECEWLFRGKIHRVDIPAQLIITGDDTHNTIRWYRHGLMHRDVGPAQIAGDVEVYYNMGILHREHGPAVISGHLILYCTNYRVNIIITDDNFTHACNRRQNDPDGIYPISLSYNDNSHVMITHETSENSPATFRKIMRDGCSSITVYIARSPRGASLSCKRGLRGCIF